ncbi:MAG: DNA methyltransferase [Nanoarchaeota archaeon]|nr:DNA methyltransferase [Nanoarchaeota archaeon]
MTNASRENRLNELSAQEWLRFTKTWFVHNPPPRKKKEMLHPAKYPEGLIEEFIRFFTKSGQLVFDPFLGTGSTLIAAHNAGRNGLGLELLEKYAAIARERLRGLDEQLQLAAGGAKVHCQQQVIQGDASNLAKIWKMHNLPQVDFVITSPPYGPMLNKKGLVSKEREEKGLDVKYSEDAADLGNIASFDEFVERLVGIFVALKPYMNPGGHLVIILKNYLDKGEYRTLAWDVGKALSRHFQLRGERLWCQDNKTLYPYGYRYSFVPNVHHHYCLILRKEPEVGNKKQGKNEENPQRTIRKLPTPKP